MPPQMYPLEPKHPEYRKRKDRPDGILQGYD
ncbi:hypothetical protein FNYG_06659 [Fusarium nygamai]|uniref:Uncharacterized protein n=1 Tax=Gibberella nygamai TaxID=42673 RepID=A0A2K0WCH5_GIBNY|nr:hypothetical protein FNYG_06659 [Fusarium nygamai]